jgi:hypothetical protein
MKYEIVREARGKKTVLDSGALPKMRDRLRQLRRSTRAGVSGRGGKKYAVTYQLRETSPRTGCYHCLHTKTARGKDAPRAWGSWCTQVCLDCGAFRMHAQDEDPSSSPSWSKSAWRPASEMQACL